MACPRDRWFLATDQAIDFVDAGWGLNEQSSHPVTGLIFQLST
jgi:hypothetical protein